MLHGILFSSTLGSSVRKSLKMSFGSVPSFFHSIFPSIHSFLLHSCAYTYESTHAHMHHTPDNHQLQGTLYCFSSMLITSGLDPRFSERAAEGDGVDVDVCVRGERSVCVCVGGGFGWEERSLLLPINCHTGFA